MTRYDDVCVLLPALDEEATIRDVVEGFLSQGFSNILVIDGGSCDDTMYLASEAGARVVEQSGTGKGQAVVEAVRDHITAPYILMVDADATYLPTDAEGVLAPLRDGSAEHVIGNRFADMRPGAMSRFNQLGNRIINWAFGKVHGESYNDILSGYRAFTRESFHRMTLRTGGFGIETEMTVECLKHDIQIAVVPITYLPRPDGSSTNLRPIRDGGVIFLELYRKAKTNNPLFYFASVGFVSAIFGSVMALYVIYRWVVFGVGHEIIAVGSAGAILLGIQLVMFGVLADMIHALHQEQLAHRERLFEENGK